MSLKGRIRIVVLVASIGLLALIGLWLNSEHSGLLSDRMHSTRDLVNVPYSVLVEQYRLETEGKLTRAEAQRNAIQTIRVMRYDGDNYFWINDLHPNMVMHPTKPELEGKDISNLKDPTGKAVFVEFVNAAQTEGGNFVFYQWPKPGTNKSIAKLSFVRKFEPWGWVVGTGVYIEDIDATWIANGKVAVGIGLTCLVILLLVSGRVSKTISHRLGEVIGRMKDVAEGEGDLTKRIEINSSDEIAELGRWFNTFMDKLERLIREVARNTNMLATASQEMTASSQRSAEEAEEERSQTTQVATAMQEMSSTVQHISENSNAAATASRKAAESACAGGTVVEETLSIMRAISDSVGETAHKVQELGRKTEQIGMINEVINDISNQTNLLALNASIEAARAGEQGRGFAVVAGEVRSLAERSSAAAKQISEMIVQIQSETRNAVEAMETGTKRVEIGLKSTGQAGKSLSEIIRTSEDAGEMVTQIAAAATEQAATTEEINHRIDSIARIITSSADERRQSAITHEEISTLACNLQRLVGQFRFAEERAKNSGTAMPAKG